VGPRGRCGRFLKQGLEEVDVTAISGYGAHVTSANMRNTNQLDCYQHVKEKTNTCDIYVLFI